METLNKNPKLKMNTNMKQIEMITQFCVKTFKSSQPEG